jgi:spermidine synthase
LSSSEERRFRAALSLFIASGAVGLLYQVVWVRMFVHVFGATVLAVSTVLAAFMGGLALGGWAGGRFAARIARPLRAYGFAELALAVFAGLTPLALRAVDPLYALLYPQLSSHFWVLSAVRFVVGVLVLLPPTVLMGATLPLLVETAGRLREGLGGRVAHLYAANTFGAVAGTAAASFLLLPALGMTRTLLLGIALNVAVALVALALSRVAPAPPSGGVAGAEAPPPARGAVAPDDVPLPRSLLLLTAGALGLAALAFEVLWTRTLALSLGTTTYAFAIVLTVFLLGIAGGSAAAGALLRGSASRARTVFLACPALIGLLALALLPVFDRLPGLFARLMSAAGGTWTEGLAIRFVLAGLPLLPPTFLSGLAFPLAVGMMDRTKGAGRAVGDVYAANTLGAILGSWGAGFLLIPLLGLRTGIVVVALLPVTATCLLLLTRRTGAARGAALGTAAAAIALATLLPDWDRAALTRGGFATTVGFRRAHPGTVTRDRRDLVFLEEGITSTITVRKRGDELTMQMNGVTEASNTGDRGTQILLGALGGLLHRDPKDVLVIGLGSGITVAAARRLPTVERVDCVEISGAVLRAARLFDDWNDHVLDAPDVHMIVGDGRNHLRLSGRKYDIIASEPSNVWNSGVGALMTSEFYAAAAEHLNDGGVLVSWIQGYALAPDALRSVLAAVRTAFPHVSLWMAGWSDLVIVAGDENLRLDVARLLERGKDPAIARLFREMAAPDVVTLLSKNILAGAAVDRYVAGFPPNTDDNLYLEFAAPKFLYEDTLPALIGSFDRERAGTIDWVVNAPPGLAEQLAAGQRARALEDRAWIAFREQRGEDGLASVQEAARLLPGAPDIADLLASVLTGRADTKARRGDVAGAAEDYLRAMDASATDAAPFVGLAQLYREAGQVDRAAEVLEEALRREPRRLDALVDRAELHLRSRQAADAEARARQALAIDRKAPGAHRALGAALAQQGRAAEAESVFTAGLRLYPEDETMRAMQLKLGPVAPEKR